MKNFSFLLLFLITSSSALAQDYDFEGEIHGRDIDKNEISIDALNILAFGILDASYERILTDNSSLGVAVFSNFLTLKKGEEDVEDIYRKDFSLTTQYKYFFSERKTAWGFYTELFGMLSTGSDHVTVYNEDPVTGEGTYTEREEDYFTDFAVGVGIGYKYVAIEGFLIDLSFGLGRNLFDVDSPNLVITPGVSFGYRF